MVSSTAAASTRPTEAPAGSRGYGPGVAVAAAVLAAHVAVNLWGPYQLHRDALLYLAMGEHLSLFRMDAPPLIALVAEGTRGLLGDSLVAIRMGPALAHVAVILLSSALVRRVGGGGRARLLTALVVATAPVYLRAGSLFQPVVFDQLWWMLSLYALARIGQATVTPAAPPAAAGSVDPRRWWLLLGVALGLGLLTKFTILVLGAAVSVAVLATPLRRWLLTPWPWLAAGLALLIGSPSVIGQIALGWPFLGQFRDLQAVQLQRVTPLGFAAEQLLMVGPVVLLGVVAAGSLLGARRHRALRPVGWATIAAFLLMMLAGGKAYYIAPIWPALLAVGITDAERWLDRLRRRRPGAAMAGWALLTAVVVGFGVVGLPMGLPFLRPEPMARYAARLGVTGAVTTNRGEVLELPQDYADMLGWEEMGRAVTRVWRGLPPSERGRAGILATSYGRAGAVDFYGGDELPPAIAPVGSYWFWGPGDPSPDVLVVVGAERAEVLPYFRTAVEVMRLERPWGVPEERDVPVVVARDPIRPLSEVWPEWAGQN